MWVSVLRLARLLCLEVFLLEEHPAFLDSFALQDCLQRDSVNQAPT